MCRVAVGTLHIRPYICSNLTLELFPSNVGTQTSTLRGYINNENGIIFIQEKAKEEDREKLGEKEETIPPDYRLEDVKVNSVSLFYFSYY